MQFLLEEFFYFTNDRKLIKTHIAFNGRIPHSLYFHQHATLLSYWLSKGRSGNNDLIKAMQVKNIALNIYKHQPIHNTKLLYQGDRCHLFDISAVWTY